MRTLFLTLLLSLAAACVSPSAPAERWPYPTLAGAPAIVIAHRGASGLLPEHTLEGYKLAVEQGADCIEPDLVMTRDGVLVSRHDTYLSTTTNVADRPEFAGRKRASPDPEFPGRSDWWTIDFTLAELKTLRAKQSFRGRSAEFDGQFTIPTFAEVLALAKASKTKTGQPVCVYPEAKSPAYHAVQGRDMLAPILADLKAAGFDTPGSPVFIQSFEPPFVKRANAATHLPLVMLVGSRADYDAAMALPEAPFWDGLGAATALLFNADGTSSGVIEAAHAKGIAVHAWTYRDDVPNAGAEAMRKGLALGLDGVFTDFPATGVRVVSAAAAPAPIGR